MVLVIPENNLTMIKLRLKSITVDGEVFSINKKFQQNVVEKISLDLTHRLLKITYKSGRSSVKYSIISFRNCKYKVKDII